MTEPITTTAPQYATRIDYLDRPGQPEYRPARDRLDAENQAANYAAPMRRTATAVERTPTPWERYVALPKLAEGETIEWGIRRLWDDGHVEVSPRPSRAGAEATVGLERRDSGRNSCLAYRVLPVWRPIVGDAR